MPKIDINTNESCYSIISQQDVELSGEKLSSALIEVQNGQKTLRIHVLLPQNQEKSNETILNLAKTISNLFNQEALYSLEYTRENPTTKRASWKKDDSHPLGDLPILPGKIYSLKADLLLNGDPETIKSALSQLTSDPKKQADIERLLPFLNSKQHRLPVETFIYCVNTFSQIENTEIREKILDLTDKIHRANPAWIPCMFLIAVQATKDHSSLDSISFVSWESILTTYNSSEKLHKKLESLGISMDTEDFYGTHLLRAVVEAWDEPQALALIETGLCTEINQALKSACTEGKQEIVSALLARKNAGINLVECAAAAIQKRHTDLLKLLGQQDGIKPNDFIQKNTLLTCAASQGNTNAVKELLTWPGININCLDGYGSSPLSTAMESDRDEVTLLLLQDPRTDTQFFSKGSRHPLIEAFFKGNDEIMIAFLRHPRIDITPLLSELERRPNMINSPYISLLEKYFPEKMQKWFELNPEIKISYLVYQDKVEEAQAMLECFWRNERPCNIVKLLDCGPKMFLYLKQKHKKNLAFWALQNQRIRNMSFQEQYLILKQILSNAHEYIDDQGVLSHEGIKLIVDYLKGVKGCYISDVTRTTPSLPQGLPVTVCKDYTLFADTLKQLAEKPSIQNGYSHLFIVTKLEINEFGIGGHVTPLFLKKVDGHWEVIITDSTTDESNCQKADSSCAPLVNVLQQVERQSAGAFPINKIYVNTFWRQVDNISCPTFALRDLVAFSRTAENMLKELSREPAKSQVQYFKMLPPDFMKPTQSLADITTYLSSNNPYPKMMYTRKNITKLETLADNITRHTEKADDGSGRIWNTLAIKRTKKYQRIVMHALINKLIRINQILQKY